jgi:hypothetical protein
MDAGTEGGKGPRRNAVLPPQWLQLPGRCFGGRQGVRGRYGSPMWLRRRMGAAWLGRLPGGSFDLMQWNSLQKICAPMLLDANPHPVVAM